MEGKTISFWGDSILKGVVLDDTDGKYKVLQNNSINAFAQRTNFNVKNNAFFGMTSTKALNRLTLSLEKNAVSDGDIIVIEYGGNDCDFNWSEVANDPLAHHNPKTPIENFKTTIQSMINKVKEKGAIPVLMNLPPLHPELYFNWISRGLKKENILKWLGDVAKIYRWQEAYNNAVEFVARQNNCRLINVRESFLVCNDYESNFCADGIHPNEKGHERILEALLMLEV